MFALGGFCVLELDDFHARGLGAMFAAVGL